jgi:hypothetical protein
MKVCVQMLYTKDWEPLAQKVIPVIIAYCEKNCFTWNIRQVEGKYDGFDKLVYIKKTFDSGDAGLVWSIDCDTLITNNKIRIDAFINECHDFYICKDVNGINAGSFIVVNTAWGNQFLDKLISFKGLPGMDCEQNAIEKYMEGKHNGKIRILPHPSINSYLYENYPEFKGITHKQGQWQEGDLLLHLPGISMGKRLTIIDEIKTKYEL